MMMKRRKLSPDLEEINFRNTSLLHRFLDSSNKIFGRKQTGLDAKKQRKLQKAVKQARSLGLIGFN
jgi:ribosomal protein S18